MMLLPRVLLFLAGLFISIEAGANLLFWRGQTPTLFQIGRFVRLIVGFIVILLSVWEG